MPFRATPRELALQLRLLPQSCGLPELCVSLEIDGSEEAKFYLDKGRVDYDSSASKRLKRSDVEGEEDLEAVYFASDVRELLELAKRALSSS